MVGRRLPLGHKKVGSDASFEEFKARGSSYQTQDQALKVDLRSDDNCIPEDKEPPSSESGFSFACRVGPAVFVFVILLRSALHHS